MRIKFNYLLIVVSLLFLGVPTLQAQYRATFGRKVIRNFHQEAFQFGTNDETPMNGSFRDFEGNLYVYGGYEGNGKNNVIDKVVLGDLNWDSYVLIKFDKDNKAVWGHVLGRWSNMAELKIFQGPDSLIYIFVTAFNSVSIGNFKIFDNTQGSQWSTFMIKLDPKTGKPISGKPIPRSYMKYSLMLRDAVVDKQGNIYVALETFIPSQPAKPDSVKIGTIKREWKEHNISGSNMGLIVKFDTNMDQIGRAHV